MTPSGVDAVWLMGVWEHGAAGVELAMGSAEQVASFRAALPDFDDSDVIGSAYCISRYEVDREASVAAPVSPLLAPRWPSGACGCWSTSYPTTWPPIIAGSPSIPSTSCRRRRRPRARSGGFIAVGDAVIARGRDPYFPPWPDVAQLNAFAPGFRRAAAATLEDIAEQADGVRCDMAMLLLNSVFARTWGDRAARCRTPILDRGDRFGPARPSAVRLPAEAYWDLEWDLQQLGFDYCYDKRLYDRLIHEGPAAVRGHLRAGLDFQRHLIRFLENHDEPRAASELDPARERAAAVAIATLPGAAMWHEGQLRAGECTCPVSSPAATRTGR